MDIFEPNRRNGYTYGLVFASVYAPNEKIELDHAVIKMAVVDFKKASVNLYTRYYFTAEIASYYRPTKILGIMAEQEKFMLQEIRVHKLREAAESKMLQPTMYVINRIQNILLFKGEPRHTEDELMDIVYSTPNDGSVERFINEYTSSCQRVSINKLDLLETLYA
ncbi:hypothetical protein [Metabacillus sp. SLBN-84]